MVGSYVSIEYLDASTGLWREVIRILNVRLRKSGTYVPSCKLWA